MERFDINNIHLILTHEFKELFLPERWGISGDSLIYEGVLNLENISLLNLLTQRFKELGYDIQIHGSGPRVALIISLQNQKSGVKVISKKGYVKHIVLFGITFLTTSWAGAMQYNVDIFKEPGKIWLGLPFSFALLMILLAHEFGHYILSQRHNILSTLPYFIPFPNIIGTMGAIIKMKSPIPDREALIDVGMAGPLAGIAVAIPVLIIGLMMSEVTIQISSGIAGEIMLGESLLFKMITWLIYGSLPSNVYISLHPVAFAGWIGLLVTFMNLFPASQLDGGHISYALFGLKHKTIGKITCYVFAIMGIFYWPWLIWMGFVLIIGIGHPPPTNDIKPLSRKKRIMGFICLAIFLLTFIPRPFYGPNMPIDLLSLFRAFGFK